MYIEITETVTLDELLIDIVVLKPTRLKACLKPESSLVHAVSVA